MKELCFYCGRQANTKDHIVAIACGGSKNGPTVPACSLCNSTKGTTDQKDFIKFMEYIKDSGLEFCLLSRSRRRIMKKIFLKDTGIRI